MPLYRGQLSDLGLSDLAADLTVTAGRKVTLMIYDSDAALLNRGDAILLP